MIDMNIEKLIKKAKEVRRHMWLTGKKIDLEQINL